MKVLIENVNSEIKNTDFINLKNIFLSSSEDDDHEKLIDEAICGKYDALITLRRPSDIKLEHWARKIKNKIIVCYCVGESNKNNKHIDEEIKIHSFSLEYLAEGLKKVEKVFSKRNVSYRLESRSSIKNIIFIGAGITNLISAFILQNKGYKIDILDSAPEPGSCWSEQGCTFGGENARMFTFTEMDNYGRQDFIKNFDNPFSRAISKGGWDIRKNKKNVNEEHWFQQYSNIPSWLASSYNEDIFSLSNESSFLWKELLNHEVFNFPDIFVKSKILRLYSTHKKLDAAVSRHIKIIKNLKVLNTKELAIYNSSLSPAIRSGLICGGFFVPGFTVMVHNLARRIINWLCHNGSSITWNSRVSAINFENKKVNLTINNINKIYSNFHVVISPGIYDKDLLHNTTLQNKLHGVLGCWGKVKLKDNIFNHSFKLTREDHTAEDANITITNDIKGNAELVFGSGYGWTGLDPHNIDADEFHVLKNGVLDTITKFSEGLSENNIISNVPPFGLRYCVRPWTASSLGLYGDIYPESQNAFIITGGHNTGGFAQSPIIAEAIYSSLNGKENTLHYLYHPDRLDNFLEYKIKK